MGGWYAIRGKPEYLNIWVSILKEKLAGYATVDVVGPEELRTVPNDIDMISSPSGRYSTKIFFGDDHLSDNYISVYVVSDGGYLIFEGDTCLTWSKYVPADGTFDITMSNWKNANETDKIPFQELYDRVTDILNKMDVDYGKEEKLLPRLWALFRAAIGTHTAR